MDHPPCKPRVPASQKLWFALAIPDFKKSFNLNLEGTQSHHLQIVFALVAAKEEVAIVEATLVVQLSSFSLVLLTI